MGFERDLLKINDADSAQVKAFIDEIKAQKILIDIPESNPIEEAIKTPLKNALDQALTLAKENSVEQYLHLKRGGLESLIKVNVTPDQKPIIWYYNLNGYGIITAIAQPIQAFLEEKGISKAGMDTHFFDLANDSIIREQKLRNSLSGIRPADDDRLDHAILLLHSKTRDNISLTQEQTPALASEETSKKSPSLFGFFARRTSNKSRVQQPDHSQVSNDVSVKSTKPGNKS